MAAPAESGDQSESFPEGADGDLQAYYDQDPELAAMMGHAKQMEAEAEQLAAVQSELERSVASSGAGTPLSPSTTNSRSGASGAATSNADSAAASTAGGAAAAGGAAPTLSLEEKEELDKRSIFVGNVDYAATAEELEQHFHGCGAINRVTIICDKFSRQPKGFAYIEFTESASVAVAIALDDSLFRGRQLKVMPKRTNLPGVNRGRGRGRGGRGGGYPPPYYYGYPAYPYPPPPPHFGSPVFRGGRARRRASWYTPY